MGKRAKFILLCVFAVCVSAAMADVMPPERQEFSGLSFNGLYNLTFHKFNDAAGTLTSIEVIFSLTITGGTLILDNDGSDIVSGTLEFGYDADITSADVSLPSSAITNNVFYSQDFFLAGNEGDGAGDYDPSPPDGLQYNGGSENDAASGYVESAFYNGYTGDGDYNIIVSLVPRLEFGEFADLEYRTIGDADPEGYVEVAYNYTPVPEPATIALLCFGGAFVILRSKTKK